MRLNIDWVAPWMYGRPRGGWWFHRWHSDKGIISGGKDWGIRFMGLSLHFTTDALWSGISFSINVCEHKKPAPEPRHRRTERQASMHSGV